MIADILSDKKFNPIVTESILKRRKGNISFVLSHNLTQYQTKLFSIRKVLVYIQETLSL